MGDDAYEARARGYFPPVQGEVIFGEPRPWRLRIPAGNGHPETVLEFPPGTTRAEAESVLVEAKRLFLEGLGLVRRGAAFVEQAEPRCHPPGRARPQEPARLAMTLAEFWNREIAAANAAADRRGRCLDLHGYGCDRAECGRAPDAACCPVHGRAGFCNEIAWFADGALTDEYPTREDVEQALRDQHIDLSEVRLSTAKCGWTP